MRPSHRLAFDAPARYGRRNRSDRLSNNPRSPHYDEAMLQRGIGIRFKGVEKTNVEEYCVSEGWVRLAVGKSVDRHGMPLTMKVSGPVEPYFRDEPEAG